MRRGRSTGSIAEAVVRRLEEHGVRHIFGIAGTHNLPYYEALSASDLVHISPRHEQGAGYAADGYARASGRPGVCLTTSGPGLTNALTAIATAHSDSVPILLMAPGMPDAISGHDTGFLHELRDQFGLVEHVVSKAVRANTPEQAVLAVDEAFGGFRSARPRPFYLEVPLDRLDCGPAPPLIPISQIAPPSPSAGSLDAAAEILNHAKRTALLIGGGGKDAGAKAITVARRLGAPIVTTVNAKGAVPENDPQSLGASIRLRCVQEFLSSRDALIVIGSELGESDLWRMPPLEVGGSLIRIDIDPGQLQKNALADVVIAAEASCALAELELRLERRARDIDVPELTAIHEAIREEARVDGVHYERFVAQIVDSLDQDAVIASDSTMACYYGLVHFRVQNGPRQLLYPTGYATLGYATPGAIGAKLALPDRQVMAVIGDGGVMFTLQEIATAVEQELSIPFVIVKNGGYGEIRRGMETRGMTPLAVDFNPPDFQLLARGFGARAARADRYADLPVLLKEAFSAVGPTVIEVWEEKE